MSSISETGHAKNVANLDELVSFVAGYGAVYNPTKTSIKLTALQTLSTSAKNAINAVNAAMPAYSIAVAAREVAFGPLNKLITRVMNALKATDTTDQLDESAKTLVRKIQGTRATAKKTDEEKKALAAEGKEIREFSSSQLSYDSRLDNFDKLNKLLTSVTLYAPNEAELKVTSLNTLYNDLKTKNTAVVNAATPLSNARLARNDVFNKANTGLVDSASDTKTYIKSLFGATSPQYKQVSKLAFKPVKA
jgi:type II secretory pathway pseudopilin PulG